jgi:methionyl-tRNA formyltransferase/predicted alpha/beta hydrolase family esterase
MLQTINHILARPLILLIRIYQFILSPDKSILFSPFLKGTICAHEPHCSAYGIEVLKKYGLCPGIVYMIDRISSCTASHETKHDPASYRIVFASSAPIGVPFLEKIHSDPRYDLVWVITNPDVASGRGMKVRPNIIKEVAQKLDPAAKQKSTILLLDGFGGDGTSNWFPWLKKELESQGYTVHNPAPLNTEQPVLEDQLQHIIDLHQKDIGEDTIIIGHSLGGLLAHHLVDKLNQKINKLIAVAPAFPGLHTSDGKSTSERIQKAMKYLHAYTNHTYDGKRITSLTDEHTVFLSEDDPFIPYKKANKHFASIFPQSKIIWFVDKGHFNYRYNILELPAILPQIYNQQTRVILLHGKDATPADKRYPRLIHECQKRWIEIHTPQLPHADKPILAERIAEIDKLNPDENTILIGHSRWWVAALRWLEHNAQKVKKVILVATNDSVRDESLNGFFTESEYNYATIKKRCDNFAVFHSTDDMHVPFEHGQKIAAWLSATTRFPEDRCHFGYNPKTKSMTTELPELLQEIASFHILPHPSTSFISTPPSLRLDSKKYAHEAQEFQSRLQSKQPDFLVVIAYGKIVPQHILDIPTIAPINVHGSLLPKYRGASPIQSVLLDDESETGITIIQMEAGLDTGPMLSKKKFPLNIHTTALDIINRFQDFWPKQLVDTMRDFAKEHITLERQDETLATHCTKLEKSDGFIDPRKDSLHHINNIYRGCYLWPKVHFTLPDDRGKHASKMITIESLELDESLREANKDQPLFPKTKDQRPKTNNAISSLTLKPANSKNMSREDFIKGYGS